MLSILDLQGLAVKKINFQLWQAVPPAANMFTLQFSSHRNVTQIDQIVLGGIFIQGKVAEQ